MRDVHRQLDGSYPLSLSIRSSDVPVGLRPISAKKLSKDFQFSQILMPRPPYLGYAGLLGLLHLYFISSQATYSGDRAAPCRLFELGAPEHSREQYRLARRVNFFPHLAQIILDISFLTICPLFRAQRQLRRRLVLRSVSISTPTGLGPSPSCQSASSVSSDAMRS